MDDILSDFLEEARDGLSQLDKCLEELKTDPERPDLVNEVFRVLHTIKGTSGFLDLHRLGRLAHAAEGLLDEYRSGAEVTEDGVKVVFMALDAINGIITEIENNDGAEPTGNDALVVDLLEEVTDSLKSQSPGPTLDGEEGYGPEKDDVDEGGVSDRADGSGEDDHAAVEDASPQPEAENEASRPAAPEQTFPEADKAASASQDNAATIRVRVQLLDHLMDMVGELVLVRNQMQQDQGDHDTLSTVQNLSQIATELQDGVMKTRMQPIGLAFQNLPSTVRQLATKLDKKIALVCHGEDTEVDRQVLEHIRDPLTHMVRNCADHALESVSERLDVGKSENGRIDVRSYHEGGHVVIKVEDDGRGISVDKVGQKALDNGVVSETELAAMPANQVRSLIFQPNFSTASSVSEVSGRGVGMDVVKKNIEEIGGTVGVESIEGRGTTFTIKIPLTLAIVSAFILGVGDHTMALPQINVQEIVSSTHSDDSHSVEIIHGHRMLRLRGELLPLVGLGDVIGEPLSDGSTILVCKVGAEVFGVEVDTVHRTEEIVVKPLSAVLSDIPIYSGNTIMGDGSVIMILDPVGLYETFEVTARMDNEKEALSEVEARPSEIVQLLLFRAGEKNIKAVHLSVISRIDKVATSDVMMNEDGTLAVRYNDSLMPVVTIDGKAIATERNTQFLIVFSDAERSMGIVVDEILDISESEVEIDILSDQPGFIGTSVIADQPTDILDVSHYLDVALGNWFTDRTGVPPESHVKVLIVDDSQFFRNVLHSMVQSRGYDVATASDPLEALDMMREENFDVLVSDIDMPHMSGNELIRTIRSVGPGRDIPAVAISSHGGQEARDLGLEAGFNDYLSKTDRASIFDYLSNVLQAPNSSRG